MQLLLFMLFVYCCMFTKRFQFYLVEIAACFAIGSLNYIFFCISIANRSWNCCLASGEVRANWAYTLSGQKCGWPKWPNKFQLTLLKRNIGKAHNELCRYGRSARGILFIPPELWTQVDHKIIFAMNLERSVLLYVSCVCGCLCVCVAIKGD